MGDQPGPPRSVLADLPPLQLCMRRVVDAISKTALSIPHPISDSVNSRFRIVLTRFALNKFGRLNTFDLLWEPLLKEIGMPLFFK